MRSAEVENQPVAQQIREWSRTSSAEFRRRWFEKNKAFNQKVGVSYIAYGDTPEERMARWLELNDPSNFTEEDEERDKHMATSGMLLDLALSELQDHVSPGQSPLYSRRTERLIDKVADGYIWAMEANIRYKLPFLKRLHGPDHPADFYAKEIWDFEWSLYRSRDLIIGTDNYPDRLKSIHEITNWLHTYAMGWEKDGGRLLIRDLNWIDRLEEPRPHYYVEVLNFISSLPKPLTT